MDIKLLEAIQEGLFKSITPTDKLSRGIVALNNLVEEVPPSFKPAVQDIVDRLISSNFCSIFKLRFTGMYIYGSNGSWQRVDTYKDKCTMCLFEIVDDIDTDRRHHGAFLELYDSERTYKIRGKVESESKLKTIISGLPISAPAWFLKYLGYETQEKQ
jgi:hypothetical protein